ncbi:glycosyltransferase [Halodesulfovibrio sp. MK-HDV]|jgi:GT2 family glycosyltransferase|uniref:glycosyltransferase n=1 Tax=unclassified Halodesulfovibrio TaxID=2644657 RepID=UPI00136CC322|nr:glycosyltransferase [Halodesulfovibrio sp. MK-HDV]KAF1075206.1 N-acetylglucosaminyl-diphospho-decaprenol L-rhamnosyltransferase [Halodesulfovibrio sp. MK-HDV]
MKLSFVIVTNNTSKFIGRCLDSIKQTIENQTASKFEAEIIVVDNASADDCGTIAKTALPEIELIQNSDDKGYAAAANQAVARATGDLIVFIDPKVEVLAGSVRRLMDQFATNASCAIAGGKVVGADNLGLKTVDRLPGIVANFKRMFGCTCSKTRDADQPMTVNFVPFTFAAVRRDIITKLGQLDERFYAGLADADFCRRIVKSLNPSYAIYYVPQATARVLDKFSLQCECADYALNGSAAIKARTRSEQMYFWKHYCPFTALFFGGMDMLVFSVRYVAYLIPGVGTKDKRGYACTVVCESAKAILSTQLGSQFPTE